MNHHKINPYIRQARYSILLNPFQIQTRVIFDYELIYIQKGKFLLNYNKADFICEKGDIILIHPGVEHAFQTLGYDIDQPHIHFDLQYHETSEITPISFKNRENMTPEELLLFSKDVLTSAERSPLIRISDKTKFLSIFFSLIDDYQTNGKHSSLSVRSKMLLLLDSLISDNYSEVIQETKEQISEMETVKNFIDANCHIEISLKLLQAHFFCSRSFLEKKFQEHYHVSVMRYYKTVKMEKAKELLKTESVTHVSEKFSFSSIFAFSRAFKNTYGISPQNFKNTFATSPVSKKIAKVDIQGTDNSLKSLQ